MAKWWTTTIVLVLLLLAAAFFLLWTPLGEARAEASANAAEAKLSHEESEKLKTQVADLESLLAEVRQVSATLKTSQAELAARQADLETQLKAKKEELVALNATHEELVGELTQEIEKGQIRIQRIQDKLQVDLVDKILFASGQAEVSEQGREVLRRVGGVLKNVTGRTIEIQGYTDNVAITGALAQRHATNWELSAARAVNVARFLQDEAGVDPTKLSAVAFSEYRPKASNDSEEGKAENRRIEILLSPILKAGG